MNPNIYLPPQRLPLDCVCLEVNTHRQSCRPPTTITAMFGTVKGICLFLRKYIMSRCVGLTELLIKKKVCSNWGLHWREGMVSLVTWRNYGFVIRSGVWRGRPRRWCSPSCLSKCLSSHTFSTSLLHLTQKLTWFKLKTPSDPIQNRSPPGFSFSWLKGASCRMASGIVGHMNLLT